MLASNKDGTVNLDKEKEQQYRRSLIEGEISFLEMLQEEKLFFNFNKLTYFGTLVTPEGSPYRFDTSFFLAHLPDGQSPTPDEYEIEDAFWVSPNEALSDYAKGRLPMIAPTILSLQTIINYQQGNPLQLPDKLNLL